MRHLPNTSQKRYFLKQLARFRLLTILSRMHSKWPSLVRFSEQIFYALYTNLICAICTTVRPVFDMHLTSHKFRIFLINRITITIKHIYFNYVINNVTCKLYTYIYRPESDIIRLCTNTQKGSKNFIVIQALYCNM